MINIGQKLQKVEMLSKTGYKVEIMRYFSEAFDIFKMAPLQFMFITLLTMVPSIADRLAPGHWALQLLVGLFMAPIQYGHLIVARKIRYNESWSFGNFFDGYQRFWQIFAVNLVAGIFIVLGCIFFVLPGIYLMVAFFLCNCFLWFMYDGDAFQALDLSRKLITKEWFSFFGLVLMSFLVIIIGLLCFGLGLLAALPVVYIANYACFEDIVGTGEESEATQVITLTDQPTPPSSSYDAPRDNA